MKKIDRSGIGLIILVILIAVSGLIVVASARTLDNMARQTQLRVDKVKAHYLAQAGVTQGVWNWFFSSAATENSRTWGVVNTTLAGTNNIFKAGMDSTGAPLQSNYAYLRFRPPTAITHVKNVVTLASKAAGTTTLALTVPVAGVARDNFLAIYVAMDGGGGVFLTPPAIDSQGNTYYLAAERVPGTDNNTMVRTALIYGEVKTALVNPNTITVRWTNNVTAKAITISEFSNVSTWDVPVVNTNIGTVTPVSTNNVTTTIANSVLVSATGLEGPSGDTFTKDVDYLWTPPTRTSTGNVACVSPANCADITLNPQYRIIAATETNDSNGILSANRDWTAVLANFHDTENWFNPSGSTRRLRTWRLRNNNSANSITLDRIRVSWTPTNTAVLNDIRLNNVSVWSGSASSGTNIDVTNTALASGFTWGGENTYLQWDNVLPDPVEVTCQFIFSGDTATSDAKTNEVVLWNGLQAGGGLPTERSFTVVAGGQVNQTLGGYFKVLKSVKATVSGGPGVAAMEIMDWDEEDKNIP